MAVTDLIAGFRQRLAAEWQAQNQPNAKAAMIPVPPAGRALIDRILPHPVSPLSAVHLLADLLEALECAITDLLAETYEPNPSDPDNSAEVILARFGGVRDLIDRLEAHELAIVAKLDRARLWAGLVGRSDQRLKRIAALFHSGTNGLADLLPRLADPVDDIFNSGGQQLDFLMARGLIADARATADGSLPIAITEDYRLCGAAPIGDLLNLCTSTLNALDAHYTIYEADVEVAAEGPATPVADADRQPQTQTLDEAMVAVISAADLVKQYGLHVPPAAAAEPSASAMSNGLADTVDARWNSDRGRGPGHALDRAPDRAIQGESFPLTGTEEPIGLSEPEVAEIVADLAISSSGDVQATVEVLVPQELPDAPTDQAAPTAENNANLDDLAACLPSADAETIPVAIGQGMPEPNSEAPAPDPAASVAVADGTELSAETIVASEAGPAEAAVVAAAEIETGPTEPQVRAADQTPVGEQPIRIESQPDQPAEEEEIVDLAATLQLRSGEAEQTTETADLSQANGGAADSIDSLDTPLPHAAEASLKARLEAVNDSETQPNDAA